MVGVKVTNDAGESSYAYARLSIVTAAALPAFTHAGPDMPVVNVAGRRWRRVHC